jgi:hypothetical protein
LSQVLSQKVACFCYRFVAKRYMFL